MDAFVKFFQVNFGYFLLASLIIGVGQATLIVVDFILRHKKAKKEKVVKPKMPKVKEVKDDHYNLIIKDEHNVIVFNQNYKTKCKAKMSIKKAIKELHKANKNPKSYKITKIK